VDKDVHLKIKEEYIMVINHNISSMNAQRNMNINSTNATRSMQKLSTGMRINTAADDAAGLSISEKMRGQIRGLDKASANAQDTISLAQTAEGALSETTSILQRMRELAVQSANDTNTTDDREAIQKEVNQLAQEIDRIANTTEFNTKKLLNGDSGSKVNFASNANVASATASEDTVEGTYAVVTTTAAEQATVTGSGTFATTDFTSVSSGLNTVKINNQTISFDVNLSDADVTATNFKNAVNNANIGVTVTGDGTGSALVIKSNAYGSGESVKIKASALTTALKLTSDASTDAMDTGVDVEGTIGGVAASGNGTTLTGAGDVAGLKVHLTDTAASTAAAAGNVSVTQNSLTAHIGANKDQTMTISIQSMATIDLGVSNLDLTSPSGAESAIDIIDTAVKTVSSERSKLGAYQNRLEHTIANLGTTSENMSSAESRIRDVDMASEMSEYSKNNILAQAAQSMIAQANQQPRQVLSLLQ
jgi:flagellin